MSVLPYGCHAPASRIRLSGLHVRLRINRGNNWGNNCAQNCPLVTKTNGGKSLKSLRFNRC